MVTGLGPVSSIGTGVKEFRESLLTGRSGISPISSFDTTGFPYVHAGEVSGFRPEELLWKLPAPKWGRSGRFAAAAARLAAEDAGLDQEGAFAPQRAAAVVGTTSGESQEVEELTAQRMHGGFPAADGEVFRRLPAARVSHAVAAELGLEGEVLTLATACSASNYALGYGYDLIASGEADVVFAGGADSVCRWAHAGFHRLGALTERACAPFDRDRSGILTGEGGAMLVLESEDSARARGALPYAELLGYGVNCDASHMVAPDAASIAECMRLAHRSAGIEPHQVDYICAHGTGTPANDAVEAQAVREVFGERTPPISSIKSMLGHTMGAASGFGAIASALALAHGFLPPTVNHQHADPELGDIDPVPNTARPARPRVVQNNGFAFGGNNAITILGVPS
nr:beta-ketoacyl-[acyl-carrier-protein] synthase family protein [Streptomyces sp. SID8354]